MEGRYLNTYLPLRIKYMTEDEKINHRFKILMIAQSMLNDEYINRRAEDHNVWVAMDNLSKLQNRPRPPYPPFVAYPSGETIIAQANIMYNFVYNSHNISEITTEMPTSIDTASSDINREPGLLDESTNDINISDFNKHSLIPGWARRTK